MKNDEAAEQLCVRALVKFPKAAVLQPQQSTSASGGAGAGGEEDNDEGDAEVMSPESA